MRRWSGKLFSHQRRWGLAAAGPLAVLVRRFRDHLHGRPDSEHVMYGNRAAFCLLQAGHFMVACPGEVDLGITIMLIGLGATFLLFVHLLLGPARSIPRQTLAMVADASYIGAFMHYGGAEMAFWYPCLLWMILGNGFRLGRANLLRSTLIATGVFAVMLVVTPFWHDHPALSVGLLLGNLILPLYVYRLLTRLFAARQDAEAANRAKSLFLASVSHELRTPLHAIIATGSLLEREQLSPKAAGMSQTISEAGRVLLEMIDDVLKLSGLESGQPKPDATRFSVPGLLLSVRHLVEAQAGEKGLSVSLHLGAGVPLHVQGAERQLREVLLNLVGNAMKFTERGGILVAVGAPGQAGPRVRLRFEVADTGIGIEQAAQERIFEKFTQASKATAERFGGTGLGLAICKRQIALLDGVIGVESRPGAGSTFWFEVDCETPDAGADAQAPPDGAARLAVRLAVLGAGEAAPPGLLAAVSALDPSAAAATRAPDALASYLAAAPDTLSALVASLAPGAAPGALVAAMEAIEPAKRPPLIVAGDPRGQGRDARWVSAASIRLDATAGELAAAVAACGKLSPARHDGRPAGAPVQPPTGNPGAADCRRESLCVLVVDDNRVNRKVISKVLESGGHRCRLAEDGLAALDALNADDLDAVIMDVNMPEMDGLEVTRLHRMASLGMARLPMIALTADIDPRLAERCREAGFDRCITKPICATELLAELSSAVAEVRAATPSGGPVRQQAGVLLPNGQPAPVCDHQILHGLRHVGGDAFVAELLLDFVADARELLAAAADAVERRDAPAYRAHCHALASVAGNVGGIRLQRLSLAGEQCSEWEFRQHGGARLLELGREVGMFHAALSGTVGAPKP